MSDLSAEQIFKMAQRYVRWHYQWIIVHEFLPLTIGQERVDLILRRAPKFYNPHDRSMQNAEGYPLIPIEFSVAAYRFGHSQVRPSYRLNFGPRDGSEIFAFAFWRSSIRTNPTRKTFAAGSGRRAASSIGRRSSSSKTIPFSGRTRKAT
ncbi:MAG TPA: peroxidase family protein, partial [Nitrospira sp.]|nr:peroxidase family protein [Nitrospira sp.]